MLVVSAFAWLEGGDAMKEAERSESKEGRMEERRRRTRRRRGEMESLGLV